jgi:hypothetical protein
MMNCANGHEVPGDQNFCGECGVSVVPGMVICSHGHPNPEGHNFCRDCGMPTAAPVAADPTASNGRWTADPTCRHEYRYWDGSGWTEHVADNGSFGTDPTRKTERRYLDWVGIAAGLVAGVLIVGVVSTTVIHFSRLDERAPAAAPSQPPLPPLNVAPGPSAAAPAQFPPTATSALPLAAVGASCPPGSINGVTADGSVAYCELLPDTGTFMWSLYQGDIESPYPPGTDPLQREDPGIAVCMDQTEKSRAECDALLPPQTNVEEGE